MENSNKTPAAATEEAAATKNGGNATQEVSSTTEVVEPTKRSLRVETWKKLQENKFSLRRNNVFNRIPTFLDSEKAAILLTETDEFKKANNVKVLIDRALYPAKLQTLLAGKNLYLPATRESKALYLKVNVPDDATPEQKKKILNIQDFQNKRTEIPLENKVELDMIIIGSVVVSRDGYRIGRGNGFNDLDIGLMVETGSITDKTIIVTTVHDSQVVDNLPIDLFKKYDTPVDIIVTPTEVIRVDKRLPRPAGIFWEFLSERRLKIVPVLQVLKETLENSGKVIVLKAEDTDVEQNHRNNLQRFMRRRRMIGRRRFYRRSQKQSGGDQQQGGENKDQQQKQPSNRRRFNNSRRRPIKLEGESKSQDRRTGEHGRSPQKQRKLRYIRDFSVKLSNISRDVRVKDVKTELRSRQCNPMAITWKGHFGRCYLHFGHRNGETSTNEEDMNKILQSLSDLSLTVTPTPKKNKSVVNGEGEGEGDGNAADQQQQQPAAESETPTVKVNLKVELIKYSDKVNKQKAAEGDNAAGDDGTLNGAVEKPTSGEATAARIEVVDTTTV